jgi:multiple sugar transport system substrate-binding protein
MERTTMTFRGLTWDHPRGYDALAEAARQAHAGTGMRLITWDKQPLEGFESAPIAELAASYDLLVLDHPHIGEAVAEDCLLSLESVYSDRQIRDWEQQSIGPSLTSYRWEGRTYGLPLDVATQVMVRNASRLTDAPKSWPEIVELAKDIPVAQSLAGPHAFLTLISMVGGQGYKIGTDELIPDEPAFDALDVMTRLFECRPVASEMLNPIAMLEAMTKTQEIALVPLIFGYVTYASSSMANPLQFSNPIRKFNGTGGVLGGTGIGISKRCKPSAALLDHLSWLMKVEIQQDFIPANGGQPSARTAWNSASVNAAWSNFYSNCADTAEHALLRPRFDGYIAFQTAAGQIVRDALHARQDANKTMKQLRAIWKQARTLARGNLDEDRGL